MSSVRACIVVGAVVAIAACDLGGPDRDALLAAVAAHTDRFDTFDAWARRTVIAEPASPSSAEFAATLFAPLRGDDAVVDAWVVREGTSPRTWRVRPEEDTTPLVDLRAPRLGAIRAGFGARTVSEARRTIVVIERARDETASTRVVVAIACLVER